ncbi:MAG TPA: hypothetical protein VHX14_05760, partial [Thermoanaerobaculia bacterium]|nr:hypothetical protein [Thermoanaerobaculia bacterium]
MTDFRLVTSELTPKVTPLLFNYESQTAHLLQTLGAKRAWSGVNVVTITSPYDVLAERVLLHASQLLPSLIESDVFLFWYRLYPGSSVIGILHHFRNFLIDAWRSGSQTHPNELAVLSFDDPELLTVSNLTSVIRSLLPRLTSTSVVAVVEVVDSVSASD